MGDDVLGEMTDELLAVVEDQVISAKLVHRLDACLSDLLLRLAGPSNQDDVEAPGEHAAHQARIPFRHLLIDDGQVDFSRARRRAS